MLLDSNIRYHEIVEQGGGTKGRQTTTDQYHSLQTAHVGAIVFFAHILPRAEISNSLMVLKEYAHFESRAPHHAENCSDIRSMNGEIRILQRQVDSMDGSLLQAPYLPFKAFRPKKSEETNSTVGLGVAKQFLAAND